LFYAPRDGGFDPNYTIKAMKCRYTFVFRAIHNKILKIRKDPDNQRNEIIITAAQQHSGSGQTPYAGR